MIRDLNAPKFCPRCRRVRFMKDWLFVPEKEILHADHLWQIMLCKDVACESWEGKEKDDE